MAITATFELRLHPESLDAARKVVQRALTETRAFDGNLGVEVLIDHADPAHWLIVEQWESLEHDEAYRKFRAGEGAVTDLAPLVTAAPVLIRYTTESTL